MKYIISSPKKVSLSLNMEPKKLLEENQRWRKENQLLKERIVQLEKRPVGEKNRKAGGQKGRRSEIGIKKKERGKHFPSKSTGSKGGGRLAPRAGPGEASQNEGRGSKEGTSG